MFASDILKLLGMVCIATSLFMGGMQVANAEVFEEDLELSPHCDNASLCDAGCSASVPGCAGGCLAGTANCDTLCKCIAYGVSTCQCDN